MTKSNSCFFSGTNTIFPLDKNAKLQTMKYHRFIKNIIRHCVEFLRTKNFYIVLNDIADLDFADALLSYRIRGSYDYKVICILPQEAKDNSDGEFTLKLNYISNACDVKIAIQYYMTGESNNQLNESLIDLCRYCVFICEDHHNGASKLAFDYARLNGKKIYRHSIIQSTELD